MADPAETPLTERLLPLTETIATDVSPELALYGLTPPFMAQVSVAPTDRDKLVGLTLNEGATVMETVTFPESPSLTVMVAEPAETPLTERRLPLTEAVATDVLLEAALYGLTPPLTAQALVAPTNRDKRVGLTLNKGATVMETVTFPELPSLTVMVAEPAETPLTERVSSLTETVATALSLETALYGVAPPLMVQVPVAPPIDRDKLVLLTPSEGTTVMGTATLLESPSLTVMVADPAEAPLIKSTPSPTETVATVSSLEAAVYGRMPPLMAQVPVAPADRDKLVGLTLSKGTTVMETVTLPESPSLTVMVADPAETPVTESALPLRETVATDVLLEVVLCGRVPPLIVQEPVLPIEKLRVEGTTDKE